jgi:hypothetical protein
MPLRERSRSSWLSARVRCPNCKADMALQTIIPAPAAEGFVEIAYACSSCKGETKRWVKTEDD